MELPLYSLKCSIALLRLGHPNQAHTWKGPSVQTSHHASVVPHLSYAIDVVGLLTIVKKLVAFHWVGGVRSLYIRTYFMAPSADVT